MTLLPALLLALAEPTAILPPPPLATPSLSEAANAIEQGRLDQARAMLGAAIAVGAKGDPVDRLLADLEYASGNNERALTYYRALLQAHPDEVLLLERGGTAALRLGRVEEATNLLDRATRQPGAGWRSWNARGAAADRQGRWDEADAAYARARALGPTQAQVPNNQGWSHMLRGEWDKALTAFGEAMLIDPKLPRLANNIELAKAALESELPRRMAGETNDDYAARLNDAGVVAAAAGDAAKAKAAFTQALEMRSRWYALAAENLSTVGRNP